MSGAFEAWITDEVGAENVGRVFVRGLQAGYAAGIVGLVLWIGLATVSLQGAVIADGAVTLAVGLLAIPLMPRDGLPPPRARQARAGLQKARDGARLVRGRPVLLLLVAAAFFAGAYTEGFDRLWEAHFIRDVGPPAFFGLSDLWWFAVLGVGAMLLGLLVSNVLVKRVTHTSDRLDGEAPVRARRRSRSRRRSPSGSPPGSRSPVLAYWGARLARSLSSPVYMTWLNQSIDDSSVRATVISLSGQSDAIGQVAGGPGIGAIGNAFGIPTALVAGGFVLTPALGPLCPRRCATAATSPSSWW